MEAGIVDRIRQVCRYCLSLVAIDDDRLVGYVLFSPVLLKGDGVEGWGQDPSRWRKIGEEGP